MKTSHLIIIGILVLSLSGMGFLYLKDKQKIDAFKQEHGIEGVSESGEFISKVKKLEENNEILRQREVIADLQNEIKSLKHQLSTAGVDQVRNGVATSYEPASPEEASEINALKNEIIRLKNQREMADAEITEIIGSQVESKANQMKLETELKALRPIAKVLEVNKEHFIAVIDPIGQPNLTQVNGKKREVWVRKEGSIALKMSVDYLDAESGKYITVIDSSYSPEEVSKIQAGDEVVLAIVKEEELKATPLPVVTPEYSDAPELPEDISSGGKKDNDAPALPDEI